MAKVSLSFACKQLIYLSRIKILTLAVRKSQRIGLNTIAQYLGLQIF